jgi:hypothetical protein
MDACFDNKQRDDVARVDRQHCILRLTVQSALSREGRSTTIGSQYKRNAERFLHEKRKVEKDYER